MVAFNTSAMGTYQILGYLVQHLFLEVLQCVGDENLAKDQLEKDENWQSRVL